MFKHPRRRVYAHKARRFRRLRNTITTQTGTKLSERETRAKASGDTRKAVAAVSTSLEINQWGERDLKERTAFRCLTRGRANRWCESRKKGNGNCGEGKKDAEKSSPAFGRVSP